LHPEEPLREEMKEVVVSLGMDVLILPFLVLLAWWMAQRMLNPISTISATADRIRTGRFVERIDTSGMPDDETRHLAETLNAAFERYAEAVERLTHFSDHVSHQLRTPMTAIRSAGEVALSRDRRANEYKETLSGILEDIDHLSTIVDQLLQLARLEGQHVSAAFENVDIGKIVQKAAEIYQPLAEERAIAFHLEPSEPGEISGNADLIIEMIGNVLHNAIRHTPQEGRIEIRAESGTDAVIIEIHDSGPGIPEKDAERIFERFHRLPNTKDGTGLGLAIAADIAKVHGGSIHVANAGKTGAQFVISLPHCTPSSL
jgi:signal transduction histidine kinase